MSTLLAALNLSKTYVSNPLFESITLRLVEGDRLGIIGPNGAGKSTLLKILAGLDAADAGEVTRRRGLRMVYVPQDDHFPDDATPLSAVIARLDAEDGGDAHHHMENETRAAITLSKLGFDNVDQPVSTLSGGWRKRLSMACALALEPELLLLDEPTNHLDIDGILWLEKLAQQSQPPRMAMAFITHDRRFLENTAQRIIELSPAYPSGLLEVAGNYSEFVRRKEEFLDGQAAAQAALANTVRRDTAWLRQGIQARRTRRKNTVVDTQNRRAELAELNARNDVPTRTTAIDFQATERKTQKLIALHGVTKAMGGRRLFKGVDLKLSPGECIGLLGPNGAGKTTLLRMIAGELDPDAGTIKRAADLRVVMFSQRRQELDATRTLQEALCPVGDFVDYRGVAIHISSWAKKFLFSADQLRTAVGNLSGGERARLFIAQLMLQPADLLLLDEPTNDLDIPSLEVLEQALLEFPGAIVLITHDRFMLERLATEFVALDGRGGAGNYASIEQWRNAVARQAEDDAAKITKARESRSPGTSPASSAQPAARTKRGKLSFKHQRDLDGMEAAILQAESEVQRLEAQAAAPQVVADHVRLADAYRELHEAQDRVQQLYARWAELEAMQQP